MSTLRADFTSYSRDLFWKHYDLEDGFIRWTGYDDANWWENVAPTQRDRKGTVSGRTYRINFDTNAIEIIEP